ncbi:MAG TPA: site-2 protease family protein [Rhodopila sp.]|nr:site-2 protease family protein [Rhodopila sp.]
MTEPARDIRSGRNDAERARIIRHRAAARIGPAASRSSGYPRGKGSVAGHSSGFGWVTLLHRFRLFSLFGFDVAVDASWLLLAILIAWTLAAAVFPSLIHGLTPGVAWTMAGITTAGIMASIVLHEAAHSLVARRYGIVIRGITLFIFGGVAEMTVEPKRPRDELLMAVAGPAASLALALILFLLFAMVAAAGGPVTVGGVLWYLAQINYIIALFNLVPAFPLDGGRMLRAILWAWRGDFDRATRIAANAGNLFATFLIVLGLVSVLLGDFIGGIWRFLLGMFLWNAASAAYGETITRRLLGGLSVARVMTADPVSAPPSISAQELLESFIYRHHHRWFPVVDGGTVIGTISTQQLGAVDRESWPTVLVGQIMRPVSPEDEIAPESSAAEALSQMRRSGQSRLLVTRNRQLLGIVSSRDLLNALSLEQELDRRGFGGTGRLVHP